MRQYLALALACLLTVGSVQAAFFGPGGYGTGFFGPGTAGEVEAVIDIDPPVDSDMLSKAQLAFGFDQLVEGYSGDVINVERTSGQTDSIGLDATGRLDTAAICSFGNGEAVKLTGMLDQVGTGEVLSFSTEPQLMASDCTFTRFGTTWDEDDGQLTRSNEGGIGINFNGTSDYGELTSSGITTASGLEFHLLNSQNLRKVGSSASASTDPLSTSYAEEVLYAYGTGTTNMIRERISASSMYNGTRDGTGASGSSQSLTNNTTNGSTGNLASKIKQYALRVSTLTNTDTYMERFEFGSKTGAVATSAGNVTANAAMTDGTLRVGRGLGSSTAYANHLFGGIIVTDSLTDFERYKIHARLAQVANQHRLATVDDLLAMADEWVDFRDANEVSGQVAGKKGHLTLQFNVSSGTPQWDFGYTTPHVGLEGLRSTTGSDADNHWVATDNYFSDVQEGSVLVFGQTEQGNIYDWLTMSDAYTSGFASGDIGLSVGRDHNAPRIMSGVDSALDTNDYDGSYGYTDGCGAGISQAMLKYGYKLSPSDWSQSETVTVECTLRAIYGSVNFPVDTVLTAADAFTYTNISPPTPEYTLASSDNTVIGYPMSKNGALEFIVGTFTPNASYDYAGTEAAREPYIKKATNKLYLSTSLGPLPGHIDSSISIAPASGNHIHMDSTYKMGSSKHQTTLTPKGTYLVWAFAKEAWTQEQIETLQTNLYKVYTEGY
jgi:hypothetical protein